MAKPQYLVLLANSNGPDIVALKSAQERALFINFMHKHHSSLKAEPIKRTEMYKLGIFCVRATQPSVYGFAK